MFYATRNRRYRMSNFNELPIRVGVAVPFKRGHPLVSLFLNFTQTVDTGPAVRDCIK
jgi:hypothetical protein